MHELIKGSIITNPSVPFYPPAAIMQLNEIVISNYNLRVTQRQSATGSSPSSLCHLNHNPLQTDERMHLTLIPISFKSPINMQIRSLYVTLRGIVVPIPFATPSIYTISPVQKLPSFSWEPSIASIPSNILTQ